MHGLMHPSSLGNLDLDEEGRLPDLAPFSSSATSSSSSSELLGPSFPSSSTSFSSSSPFPPSQPNPTPNLLSWNLPFVLHNTTTVLITSYSATAILAPASDPPDTTTTTTQPTTPLFSPEPAVQKQSPSPPSPTPPLFSPVETQLQPAMRVTFAGDGDGECGTGGGIRLVRGGLVERRR